MIGDTIVVLLLNTQTRRTILSDDASKYIRLSYHCAIRVCSACMSKHTSVGLMHISMYNFFIGKVCSYREYKCCRFQSTSTVTLGNGVKPYICTTIKHQRSTKIVSKITGALCETICSIEKRTSQRPRDDQ